MERVLREKLANGRFDNVSALRSEMMRAVKGQGNKSTELKFCAAVENAGMLGWTTHEKMVGNPDLFFSMYNIAVFLDGCFWHGCPNCGHVPKNNHGYWKKKLERNAERDIKNTLILKEKGYLVIRFWECELNKNINACMMILNEHIEENLIKLSDAMSMN